MFGIDLGSFILIVIVAIIFLGPDKLPDILVQAVKFFRSFKNAVQDAKDTIQKEIDIQELKTTAVSYKAHVEELAKNVTDPIQKESTGLFDHLTKEMSETKTKLEEEIHKPLGAPKTEQERV